MCSAAVDRMHDECSKEPAKISSRCTSKGTKMTYEALMLICDAKDVLIVVEEKKWKRNSDHTMELLIRPRLRLPF
jgi:hypothetical protein